MNLTILLVVWVGAGRVNTGSLQVGSLMALVTYTMQVITSFVMISMFTIMFSRAEVSLKRISEVLDSEPTVLDPMYPETSNSKYEGQVVFQNVSFRYPGAQKEVLHDLSFTVEAGKPQP